jgi:tetratricopeptide (TPR) repeat protein
VRATPAIHNIKHGSRHMKFGTTNSAVARWGALAALALIVGLSSSLAPEAHAVAVAQQEPGGRFRVLVVPLNCRELDKKFGEKVARAIGSKLEDFSTHAPIEEKEYKRALKRYEIKQEDLNQIKARQLANLMGAQVVYYGSCSRSGTGYEVDAGFIDVKTGDEVKVPALTIADKNNGSVAQVAEASISAFQEQVRFVRARQFCAEYVGSQQPENALRNCNEALEINPSSGHALFNKGMAFRQLFENGSNGADGWADSAVVYFQKVLDLDPGHRDALQNLAYIYSQLGEAEKASERYKEYLELDPGNVPVRLKVAYDLAQAGLMAEAIDIIKAGLEYAEEDVDLLQSLGDYALRYSSEDSSYVDIALGAYERVLEIKGEETDQSIIENALAAYTRANRTAEAIAFAEKALQSFSDSPRLWSLYADALGRVERYADASAAMDSALELDPSYPNGYLKRGQFKLQNDDEAGAIADFRLAIESGSSTQEDVYRLFYSAAHGARNDKDYSTAIAHFEHAAQFAPADKKADVEFWWAYTYYQLGERLATPESASVGQLRRAQSDFQAALQHFKRAGNVRKEIPQLKDATEKWLLNVEARIKQLTRR